jgi:hypothetical protein
LALIAAFQRIAVPLRQIGSGCVGLLQEAEQQRVRVARALAEPEVEAAWRAEFKRIGETQVRDALDSITDEPKRQAAFRWLGDEAAARRLREEQTHHYVRWTFFAAVAAVIVGLIGVGLTLLH